jgi:hypothetical protein
MLIAVLVLALFGLWSLPVVALLLAALIGQAKAQETLAEGAKLIRKPRWRCQVCGAHSWTQELS